MYNSGGENVDISGWFIDDNGGTEKFTVPSNVILFPNSCISFESGKFYWNTASSDSARLLNGDTLIDEYSFSRSPGSNISFGRSPDGTGDWTTMTVTSRDKLNSNGALCFAPPTPTPTPTLTPTNTPTPTPTPRPTPKPTKSPTPTPTPKSVVTQKTTVTLSPSRETSESVTLPRVLGESTLTATASSQSASESSKKLIPAAIALALVGMGLAILSGVFIWQKRNALKEKIV